MIANSPAIHCRATMPGDNEMPGDNVGYCSLLETMIVPLDAQLAKLEPRPSNFIFTIQNRDMTPVYSGRGCQ